MDAEMSQRFRESHSKKAPGCGCRSGASGASGAAAAPEAELEATSEDSCRFRSDTSSAILELSVVDQTGCLVIAGRLRSGGRVRLGGNQNWGFTGSNVAHASRSGTLHQHDIARDINKNYRACDRPGPDAHGMHRVSFCTRSPFRLGSIAVAGASQAQ